MEQSDREKIQKNLVPLSKLVNVAQVAKILIGQGVIDHEFLERIQHPVGFQKNQEFFLMYTKRGPRAFSLLVQALMATGHVSEARLLDEEQALGQGRGALPPPRNRIGSLESPSESESLSSSSSNSHSGSGSVGGGVQPIFQSPESSSASSCPSSSSSLGGSEKKLEKFASRSAQNILPTALAMGDLNISSIPTPIRVPLHRQRQNGAVPTPPPSPINKTPIRRATQYNQGKLSEEEAYPMMSSPRGYCLIINNINFPSDPESIRTGAEYDSENLRLMFEELGFSTTVRLDQNKNDLTHYSKGIFAKFRAQFNSYPRVDAAVIVIMSHGMEESKIRTCDPGHNYIDLYDDVIMPFNNLHCPALLGKPKLFIVQTCRGGTRDRGIRSRNQMDGKNLMPGMASMVSSSVCDEPDEYTSPLSQPSFEDIMICYPTIPGYVANRDTERGTWYVQCFVEAVRQHAHDLELSAILRKVGLKMRVVNNEYGEKQMCSFKNIGFHRELYFNPGIFADD